MLIRSNLVDIPNRRIYPAEVTIEDGIIANIEELHIDLENGGYLLPGFIDAHIHIESSMMPPSEFARLAVVHGTVGTVSDPHEIANVLGLEGVEYMIRDAQKVPFHFCFGAPSCVPATTFETSGATLDAHAVQGLLDKSEIGYLSEVMNFPGVINEDEDLMLKMSYARGKGKPIDGHAPGLKGQDSQIYFSRGISTDHECFSLEEGIEKAKLGVKILIREGSAARNYEALHPIISKYPKQVMFCSDDKHPDDLIEGHINLLVKESVARGYDLFDVLYAACIHPVEHYKMNVGQLKIGDFADFIKVKDLSSFEVVDTYLKGELVAQNGHTLLEHTLSGSINNFKADIYQPKDFSSFSYKELYPVIKAIDGEIVTGRIEMDIKSQGGKLKSDVVNDILKIAVINRYEKSVAPAIGLINGFGLKNGAIASSVAHDSHNVVVIGTNDVDICRAANAVIESKGGICAVCEGELKLIELPIAGLMSSLDGYELAREYIALDQWVKSHLGCDVAAPFMLLSFMALPVIPALKMTDKGVFDVEKFELI